MWHITLIGDTGRAEHHIKKHGQEISDGCRFMVSLQNKSPVFLKITIKDFKGRERERERETENIGRE